MANTTRFAEVYDLPRAVYTGTHEPLAIRDPIYPRKAEVHRGSRFTFYGHSIDEPTEWIVEDIINESRDETGRVRHSVYNARTSGDWVLLRNDRTRETRRLRFRWLSISAAWRLKDPAP